MWLASYERDYRIGRRRRELHVASDSHCTGDALLIVASGAGMAWWLAACDRDIARAALAPDQGGNAELRASISEQNRAVEGRAAAKLAAQQRGVTAQVAAVAAGKKYDRAQAQLVSLRAMTCDDAIPAVRHTLESV